MPTHSTSSTSATRAPDAPIARRRRAAGAVLSVCVLGATVFLATSAVAAPVGLGTAESFAVLAGAGITNTGPTSITGDIGTFPTTDVTGAADITLDGTNHAGDAVTQGAKPDLVTAYDDAAGRLPATSVPVELGGTTKLAGVYTSPTLGLTGTLTLDGQGDPNAEFVFKAGSTLITASNSRVLFINGANPCRVVWQVGSSATFGTGTAFVGNVLAMTSITAETGATFEGRLLARGGAVTLDTNTITRSSCAASGTTTTTGGGSSTTTGGTGGTSTTLGGGSSTTIAGGTDTTTPGGTGGTGGTGGAGGSGGSSTGGTPGGPDRTTSQTSSSIPSLPATGSEALILTAIGLALLAVGGILMSTRRLDV